MTSKYIIRQMPTVHVYPAESQHGEAYIVGNRAGLEKLWNAITEALNSDESEIATADVYAKDGEGYDLIVVEACDAIMDETPLPYTDWYEDGRPDGGWPDPMRHVISDHLRRERVVK